MALPKIGLQAVLEGFAPYQKALDTINKRTAESTQKMKEAAKAANPLDQGLQKLGISVEGITAKISRFTGINQQAIQGVFQITQALGPMAVAIGAGALAAVGLGAAFIALGNRGAPLVGLAESFDRLTASVGVSSQTLLKDLRQAAAGTVSDFDLMKRANLALVGSTGQFGKEFGQKLPKVLEAARAAARATGQDVDFLFQSLVAGIKRASPRLIDNTGIVLKLGAANQALADQLGKSVEALTDEEKQIAVLNATVEAGQNLIGSLGGSLETNSEKLARSQATITNIFDTLAVAVQPAFATILDIVNRVLSAFQALATGIAPILGAIASIITDILGSALNTLLDIISPIVQAIASFLPYLSILFQGIANLIHGITQTIGNVVRGIVTFIQDVAKNLFGLDITNLGKALFEGAARAFGAFANGILAVANALIFPAIIGIAQFIADFLIGFSPPKLGPLSDIDKGGENLMLAWLDGIAGVSLDPVEQVTKEVSLLLGDIGKASLPAVDARLKQLDVALLPFQNRLDIVKSQFEAIAAPAQAALDAIDRQMMQAQEALARGDVGAADTIRRLDAARAAIQGQLDAQQAVVDQQQIQLGLATAAQAQERALLNIRKAQFQAVQKATAAAGAAVGATKEPKLPSGAAAPPETTPGGAGGFLGPSGPSSLDLISGQSAVDEAIAGIQDAFAGQIDTAQLATFQENQGLLQTQLDRIGGVDLGAKLRDKFKGLSDAFDPAVEGSPANIVSKFFSPDPATPGSLSGFVNSIGPTIEGLIGGAKTSAENFFDSIFNPNREDSAANAVQTLFAGADVEGSIANLFANLGPNIEAAKPAVEAAVKSLFDPTMEGTPANFITNAVKTLTGDQETAESVASFFAQLPDNVSMAASGLWDQLKVNVFDPVSNFLTGTGENTLSGVIDGAVNFFIELPGRVVAALQGFGASVYTAVVLPVINAVNSLIALVEGALKGFVDGISSFLQGIADGLGALAPQFLLDAINGLKSTSAGINFGRISTDLPSFLVPTAVPGAARGGLFGPGAINVGERGPERIFAASKIGVLPAELTRALEGLGSILAQPAPMTVPAGNTYNTSNSSSSFNFYGVQGDNDARRRYNALRAGMR